MHSRLRPCAPEHTSGGPKSSGKTHIMKKLGTDFKTTNFFHQNKLIFLVHVFHEFFEALSSWVLHLCPSCTVKFCDWQIFTPASLRALALRPCRPCRALPALPALLSCSGTLQRGVVWASSRPVKLSERCLAYPPVPLIPPGPSCPRRSGRASCQGELISSREQDLAQWAGPGSP